MIKKGVTLRGIEVFEALGPLAQPELLETKSREADVVERRKAESETETVEAPIARNVQ